MHRTPNNAQNTQHKLGVAFSSLERNKGAGQFYNPNTFFQNWNTATYSRKSRWGCIAIHQNVCQQEFEPKLPRDDLKMSRNKSFDVRARLGAIYSSPKTKKYFLENSTISNRLLFSELANIEFTCPEYSNWWLLLPDSNLFLKFQNNFTAEFLATFSHGLLLQRFSEISLAYYYINKSRH